jgi:hypothetical protein
MKLNAKHNNMTFEIVEDSPEVGFYLLCYDSLGKNIHDYLQDNPKMAKELAWEQFGVPLDSWTEE